MNRDGHGSVLGRVQPNSNPDPLIFSEAIFELVSSGLENFRSRPRPARFDGSRLLNGSK